MLHIIVGTKAQFIKMAPIMLELERRGVCYNFIDTGQHAGITFELVKQFNLRPPDILLRESNSNISSLIEAISWTLENLIKLIPDKNRIFNEVFNNQGGVCMIHGDTLTTLISLLYAKKCGIKVAHIEAGLRSYSIFNPFPEEIIRIISMKYSDILFAPSLWAYENLKKMGYQDKSINIGSNTGLDSVRYALNNYKNNRIFDQPYVVITTHRFETIYSRNRITKVIELAEKIADNNKVIFILHEPTYKQLCKFKIYNRIHQNTNIKILPLQPYLEFINLLAGAQFIVTDGGSIQEESYFLNVPCLIIREKTERIEGLGDNIYLSGFQNDIIEKFYEELPNLSAIHTHNDERPSSSIVDHILSLNIN